MHGAAMSKKGNKNKESLRTEKDHKDHYFDFRLRMVEVLV